MIYLDNAGLDADHNQCSKENQSAQQFLHATPMKLGSPQG